MYSVTILSIEVSQLLLTLILSFLSDVGLLISILNSATNLLPMSLAHNTIPTLWSKSLTSLLVCFLRAYVCMRHLITNDSATAVNMYNY